MGALPVPDRRYRVLYVCSHPVQYIAPLFRRMSHHPEVDLTVAYCRMLGAKAGYDAEFATTVEWDVPLLDGYHWVEIPNKGTGSEGFWGLYNPGLWKFVREGKYDAVFCPTGYIRASFWITLLASKLSGAAFVFGTDAITFDSREVTQWKIWFKRIFWPPLFRRLASQVLVTCTPGHEFMHSIGIPNERITIIPNIVDNDWWTEQASKINRERVRASWGINPDTFVVMFCAKLQPWKRPLDLLHGFAEAALSNSLLLYAGEGAQRQLLETESKRLNISEKVRFLGFTNQSQLPAIYAGSDLLVLLSYHEPFGLVVNEAMLCGCAAAVSDHVGSRRDLIDAVDPSFVYPCGDTAALGALLRRLASDRPLLERFRAKAKERIRTWSPQQWVEAHLEALRRTVPSPRSS